MKKAVSSFIAFVLGVVFGIFGVFVSVFADASMKERLTLVAMLLPVYALLAFIISFFARNGFFWPGTMLVITGVVVLVYFLFKEFQWYMPPYLVLLVAFSMGGAYLGNRLAVWRRKILEERAALPEPEDKEEE